MRFFVSLIAAAGISYTGGALAQAVVPGIVDAPPTAACERPADASAWLPCGPDRVLNGSELKQYIVKDGWVTRAQVKGGDSGKIFFMNFLPDGTMQAGQAGGPNIGKAWTLQGDKVCRTYYRFFNGPQCGAFELKAGILYLVDADNSRNPLTNVEFVKP